MLRSRACGAPPLLPPASSSPPPACRHRCTRLQCRRRGGSKIASRSRRVAIRRRFTCSLRPCRICSTCTPLAASAWSRSRVPCVRATSTSWTAARLACTLALRKRGNATSFMSSRSAACCPPPRSVSGRMSFRVSAAISSAGFPIRRLLAQRGPWCRTLPRRLPTTLSQHRPTMQPATPPSHRPPSPRWTATPAPLARPRRRRPVISPLRRPRRLPQRLPAALQQPVELPLQPRPRICSVPSFPRATRAIRPTRSRAHSNASFHSVAAAHPTPTMPHLLARLPSFSLWLCSRA